MLLKGILLYITHIVMYSLAPVTQFFHIDKHLRYGHIVSLITVASDFPYNQGIKIIDAYERLCGLSKFYKTP